MKCNKMKDDRIKALAEFLEIEEVEGFKIFDTLKEAHNNKKRILCFTEHKITGNLCCIASTKFYENSSCICIHTSIYEDDIFYIIEDNEKNREIMEKII